MTTIDDKDLIRELENRFNQNKKSLEDLQDLTEQLKSVNKKLEESETLKSHFLSNIRNEIINPFTSIINLSKQISSLKNEDLGKSTELAYLIYSEAFELDFQLKNIFAAAELEAGEAFPQIYSVDVPSLVNSIVDSYQNNLKNKNLKVVFDNKIKTDSTFKTDPEKINLIFSNIFYNAINFSKDNGSIEVNIYIENNVLMLSVVDHGIGIDKEKQTYIFDRFKRVDDRINTLNKGHGLGLSVASALVDLLDGSIQLDSKINEGSNFTMLIPEANPDIEVKGTAMEDNELFF